MVCDDGWNINAGHVVCRQLGFSRATTIHEGGEFGPGKMCTLQSILVTLIVKHISQPLISTLRWFYWFLRTSNVMPKHVTT